MTRSLKPITRLPSIQEIGFVILLVFGALLLVTVLLAGNIALAHFTPGGEQLLLRWSGARAFFIDRVEPYSSTVAQNVQQVFYGRLAQPGEYPYVLDDPFFIVLLYVPIALFQNLIALFSPSFAAAFDFAFSRAVWMLLSEAALIGTLLLVINLAQWQLPRGWFVPLALFCILNFYSVQSLLSASPSIFLVLFYAWILLALRSYNDELAGALLAFVAYQWQVGALFFLFVLYWANAQRRWRLFAGLGMTLFILLAISFLTYPGWALPYFRAVLADWKTGINFSFGQQMRHWYPDAGSRIGWAVTSISLILLMVEWFAARRAEFRRVVWTACLSLAMTPLIGVPLFLSNVNVLVFPFVLILTFTWERWSHSRAWLLIVLLLFAFIVPWAIYDRGLIFRESSREILSIGAPLFTIVGLYWVRWWASHPPRVWADQLGEYR